MSYSGRNPCRSNRRAFCLAVVAVSASLAGCAHGSSPPKAAGLCGPSHASVQRMVMTRTVAGGKRLQRQFSFGPVKKVDNAPAVESVAKAFCSLPMLPANTSIACAGGVGYSLRFYTSDSHMATVRFQATNCRTVNGLSGQQSRIYTAGSPIWRSLGEAIDIPAATLATFAGKRLSAA
jgi:hypothetical protein